MKLFTIIFRPLRFIKNQLVAKGKWTSFDYGHRHSWNPKAKYTTQNGFHNHKINKKKMIAEMGGIVPHSHRLLK